MAKKRKPAKRSPAARKKRRSSGMSDRQALSVAKDSRKSAARRAAALAYLPTAICEKDEYLQAVLEILLDQEQPADVRYAALQTLQAASFSTIAFQSCRGEYVAALRKLAQDPDAELRQRALGVLAAEKDGFAQKKLLQGLQDPEKALVSPEKALELLSYDIHADAYPIARQIVKQPPNPIARREALRLLSSDPGAAGIFEKCLLDKQENSEIRQIAAAALQALNPEKLHAHAKKILMDASDDDEIQATCLTALTHFGDEGVGGDKTLLKGVKRLGKKSSRKVKQSVRQFLNRYEQ